MTASFFARGAMAVLAGVLTMGGALSGAAATQDQASSSGAEHFTAFAVAMGTPGRTGANTVDIQIERWSSDEDRDKLLTALREQGQDKMLSVLQSLPRVGYIRTPESIGYDLHFARKHQMGGSERVIIATDRRIGFWEAANRPRSIDYPFSLIEMRIGSNGKGEGKLSIATKITTENDGKTIVLENYQSQPVMLNNVTREKKTNSD